MTKAQKMMQFLGIKNPDEICKCEGFLEIQNRLENIFGYEVVAFNVNSDGLVFVCNVSDKTMAMHTYHVINGSIVCAKDRYFNRFKRHD